MSDAVVHVFDPGEPGKTRDFTCSIHTLTHGMRYFKDVLQKSVDSRAVPVEISVHCDVAVFEWLLGYCNGRVTREHITVEGVLPLLIASNFLQMDTLVSDCLSFMASNLVTVAVHQQQLAGQGGDLTALPLELLSRLARLVPERKLEELASLTPVEVRTRHLSLVNRLYKYKLEGCLRELRTTVARCSACQGLFSLAERAKLECPGPSPPSPAAVAGAPQPKSSSASQAQRRNGSSSSSTVHIPDAAWRLQEYLSSLRSQQVSWRGIYWHIWGLVHVVYCHTCMRYAPAAELRSCTFHPQAPVFTATAAVPPPAAAAAAGGGVAAAPRHLATGFYPCCGAAATRSSDPRVTVASGCCAREHRLVPSGQAPGAPLPPGLTPELITTLQHCTSLFTNPSGLMMREGCGDEGPQRTRAAAGDRRTPAVASSSAANTITAATATAVAAAADGAAAAAAARSPHARHVSFLSNTTSAPMTGSEGADADGRLVPPTMQAMLTSSTAATASAAAAAVAAAVQRRNGGPANAGLGPAMAATAAALGYSLNGMPGLDLGASDQGPPQLPLKTPPLQQQQLLPAAASPQSPLRSQSSFSQATATAALTNSPLQITGNPQVDTRRVAAAVIRRLSRSSGGSSGSGSGAAAVETSAQAQQLMMASLEFNQPHVHLQQQQHQHQRKQPIVQEQRPQEPYEHQQQHQQQPPQHQQLHSRRLLGTARSFTSLAALQQVAEGDAAMRLPLTTPHGSVSASVPRLEFAQPPWEDWERALGTDLQTSFPAAAAAGAASLRMLLKAAPPPPPKLSGGGAGSQGPVVVLERSPRHRKHPTRSPHHHRGNPPHQPLPMCMFASLNLEPLMVQLAPPPPTPSPSSMAGGRASPNPRDVSPPRSSGGGGSIAAVTERRGPLRASGQPLGERNPPPPLQQQVQLQAPLQTYLRHQSHQSPRLQRGQLEGGDRDRALHRGLSERSSLGSRREAALPPRPMGLTAAAGPDMQRRHSGSSWTHLGTDSGGGEDDDDRSDPQSPLHKCKGNGADWIKRRLRGGGGGGGGSDLSRAALNGSSSGDCAGTGGIRGIGGSSGSLSGAPSAGPGSGGGGSGERAGGGGGGSEPNPLQRSVQAVLMQQRQRRQEVQEEQPSHSQQPPLGSNPQHHQAPAHRQRSAGKVRHGLGTGSWGSGLDAAAAAAAEEQARRVLIEQYKTQKVLSPRPKNVHMIAISELPSGPAGCSAGSSGMGEGLSGRVTSCGQSSPGAAFGIDNAETPTGARMNPFNGAPAGALTARSSGSVPEVSADSAGLFALAQDELDAPDPPPPTPVTTAVTTTTASKMAADRQPARGRKLRMELLYEDDSYRMDLLEKHLLACRPSNRMGTTAVGARDQKALRGRLALAPSSRAAGGLVGAGGTSSRGRPLSAAAALYRSRQTRPRSRSVSHLQRLQNTYASGPGTGSGYAQSGRVSGTVDAKGCRGDSTMGDYSGPGSGMNNSYMMVDPRNGEAADWEKMGTGWNAPSGNGAGGGGFGATRRFQEARPLSAPRTWRYT
ncbi:hypothetical protein VaNZ11_013056 [Volvox africanus]|uniref:SANT and BTB domain-containing protein n=1 Tax=Volvox africanus TaxID=51714 RepID=A0ABQ5SHB3_9CHLO|nr:hypothetical protein VaNZ11_013056 [Volvox africanus]